jgi:hypothetical protein
MSTLSHGKMPRNVYFHAHPLHGTFSLLASFALTAALILLLVASAR